MTPTEALEPRLPGRSVQIDCPKRPDASEQCLRPIPPTNVHSVPPSESLNPFMNAATFLDPRALATSEPRTRKGTILRYKADRISVSYTLLLFFVHAGVFFLAPTWLAALLVVPLAAASMFVAAINHHHQHLNTFRSSLLNRVFELALSLQTGIAPFAWVLHHNLGHHQNYLHQRPHEKPDESRWTRRDGSKMGRIEYTIDLLLHHQIDIVRVGLRYPKYFRPFLLMKIPLWTIIGLALYYNPTNAVLCILLPGFLTLAHTAWVTYEHHAGKYPTSHYDASHNNLNPLFNWMTCNLGFHTAHHKRPGVHWSLLPAVHEEIKDRIPAEMVQTRFW
jgi:fatty acid desaturase